MDLDFFFMLLNFYNYILKILLNVLNQLIKCIFDQNKYKSIQKYRLYYLLFIKVKL